MIHTRFLPTSNPQSGEADEEVSGWLWSVLRAGLGPAQSMWEPTRNPELSHGGGDSEND